MLSILQFSSLPRSDRIKYIIKEGMWHAVLMLNESLDFDWSKLLDTGDRAIIDHLQRISPLSDETFINYLFKHSDDIRGIETLDKDVLNNAVCRGTFDKTKAKILIKNVTSYDAFIKLAKGIDAPWTTAFIEDLICNGCSDADILSSAGRYIRNLGADAQPLVDFAVEQHMTSLLECISGCPYMKEFIADSFIDRTCDHLEIFRLCGYMKYSDVMLKHICKEGLYDCVKYIASKRKVYPKTLLLYSAYCDDDDDRQRLFTLFNEDIRVSDALDILRTTDITPLQRLQSAGRLPISLTDQQAIYNNITMLANLLTLDDDHDHTHISDKWIHVKEMLGKCCVPHAIKCKDLYIYLRNKFGSDPIHDFHHMCLFDVDIPCLIDDDIDFADISDHIRVISTIIAHHRHPEKMLIKFFRERPEMFARVIDDPSVPRFDVNWDIVSKQNIAYLIPLMKNSSSNASLIPSSSSSISW